jgi:hypothetical protein
MLQKGFLRYHRHYEVEKMKEIFVQVRISQEFTESDHNEIMKSLQVLKSRSHPQNNYCVPQYFNYNHYHYKFKGHWV